MATQPDIADFISRRIGVGRVQPGTTNYLVFKHWPPRYQGPTVPSYQQIANELVAHAEFKNLRLGGVLNSPSAEFLEHAVEWMVPRALSPEFEIIVAGLSLADYLNRSEKWGKALLAVGAASSYGPYSMGIGKAA